MRFNRRARYVALAFFLMSIVLIFQTNSLAQAKSQGKPDDSCSRGAPGSEVPEPEDLRSKNGELRVELAFRSFVDSHGLTRYCYIDKAGNQSPTLRVKPGDRLTLMLRNELPASPDSNTHKMAG